MYGKIKKYVIGDALTNAQTVFDAAKLELMFNIVAIYLIMYVLGTIPIILEKYWIIILVPVVGVSLIVATGIALKKTKSVKLPGAIWLVSGIFFTFSSAILNKGGASFIGYSFAMVNLTVAFFVLDRFLRNLAIIYYSLFLGFALSVTLGILPELILPFDMSKEHEFFDQPNIHVILIALAMIIFIIDSFIKSHKAATQQILEKKQMVIRHKEQIEKKNETFKTSIALTNEIQAKRHVDSDTINTFFSDFFHFHLPKENLSGEFFWIKRKEESVYFAVVDTSEIGVPGAMFSFMIKNALERAIKSENIFSSSDILNYINKFISDNLSGNDEISSNVKISLCQLNSEKKTLHVVGVAQPIIVEKKGQLKTYSPLNQKLDYLNTTNLLDEVVIQLDKGDIIYMFSDGVSGGGVMTGSQAIDFSKFKSVVYKYIQENMTNKKELISSFYTSLKEEGKQKDDITIVGLKV